MTAKHKMQKLEISTNEVIRFVPNEIVRFLYETSASKMNELAVMEFSDDDRMQFAQLLGYSVSGFGDLPYASKATVAKADKRARKLMS